MAGIFWPRRSRQPQPPQLCVGSAGGSSSERLGITETSSQSYGSQGDIKIGETKRWEWEYRGDPWELLKIAAISVGRQYAALCVISLEVFFTPTSKRFMSCDGRKHSRALAVTCEVTKASARFFPVLAMLISLMVAVRMILRCRIYYEMLKRNILVDFENPRPLRDHLFLVLLGCIACAFSHFFTSWIYSWYVDMPHKELVDNMKASVVFYFAPTAAFLGFLFNSYDTEADLLPLSKYMEEDPEAARNALSRITVITEASAIRQLHRERLRPDDPGPCTATDLYMTLASKAAADSELPGGEGDAITSGFVTTMWPARVLLDRRLGDEESLRFRKVWHIIVTAASLVMVVVLFFFAMQGKKDVQDVQEGQIEDAGALFVELVYVASTCWLLHRLYRTMNVQ